jgi:hypothetical protein
MIYIVLTVIHFIDGNIFNYLRGIVADPHHLEADPDPACHFDADADLDPALYVDVDPDPTFHFDTDRFEIKAQNLDKVLK